MGVVGWTFGSSFGVFAIGNSATRAGSYWWTFSGGAVVVLAWTPAMINSRGLDGAMTMAGAAFTSLISEIVVYYISEGNPVDQRVRVYLSPTVDATALHSTRSPAGCAMTISLML
jgi:hypothetical protein